MITGTRLGSTGDITLTPSPPGLGRGSPRRRTRARRSPPPFSRCAPPLRPIAARASRRKNPRCLFPGSSVPRKVFAPVFSETRCDARSDCARGSHPPFARQTPARRAPIGSRSIPRGVSAPPPRPTRDRPRVPPSPPGNPPPDAVDRAARRITTRLVIFYPTTSRSPPPRDSVD